MKGIVGHLKYDDCDRCVHMDEHGNCLVDDTEFIEQLDVDGDDVICGCYDEPQS